jgi:WD40 repeat protein
MLNYVRFPFPREGAGEFGAELLADSVSLADLAEVPPRNVSFAQQLYAEDPTEAFGDGGPGLWQTRPSQDTAIVNFEGGFIGEEFASFTNPAAGLGQRALTLWEYRKPGSDFTTFNFESNLVIDSMCMTSRAAWFLSKTTVLIISFSRFDPPRSVDLPASGSGVLMPFLDGVVVGFSSSQSLYCVDPTADVNAIPLPFKGVTCMTNIKEKLICGVTGSAVLHLLTCEGVEERVFLGHCGPVTRIERLSDNSFASSAQDNTVRVWDVRDRTPISTILLPNVGVTALAGSRDYVICAFQNKRVGVVRLTGDRPAAILGIQTQDFTPFRMVFDPKDDVLYMFAVREGDQRIMFAENGRKGRTMTLFRRFQGFIRGGTVVRPPEIF